MLKESPNRHGARRFAPLKLGESEGAKKLRKRLGEFEMEEPVVRGDRERPLITYLLVFGLERARLKGKKVLFVGSGCGNLLEDARKSHIEAFGVEPKPENKLGRPKGKEFIIARTVQKLAVPKKPFDYVIALWSVPYYLHRAYDVRLGFFRMLSSLKVGGKLYVAPLRFQKFVLQEEPGDVAPSLSRKILKSGFKITNFYPKESAGYDRVNTIVIERTKNSDIRKLQELLSL